LLITNGTAVLGLGDIGAGAGLPVMEGKAVLFKTFGGVDAFPICLNTKDVDEMLQTMTKDAIVFAMANPVPEILPDDAKAGGALIVGTGRLDFPNQINNVLAFPGIFRGALDVRAKEINKGMKLAAAYAIAELITEDELKPNYIIPEAFDLRLAPKVATYVAKATIKTGVTRRDNITPEIVEKHTKSLLNI